MCSSLKCRVALCALKNAKAISVTDDVSRQWYRVVLRMRRRKIEFIVTTEAVSQSFVAGWTSVAFLNILAIEKNAAGFATSKAF